LGLCNRNGGLVIGREASILPGVQVEASSTNSNSGDKWWDSTLWIE